MWCDCWNSWSYLITSALGFLNHPGCALCLFFRVIKKKICRSEAYGKKPEKMQVMHLQGEVSATAGQNVLNYTWNPHRTSATPHFCYEPSSPWVPHPEFCTDPGEVSRHCISLCWWACWKLPPCNLLLCDEIREEDPWDILEQVMCMGHSSSCSPAHEGLSMSHCGDAIKTVQREFPQAGNPKENLHQCVYTLLHLFHSRVFCWFK